MPKVALNAPAPDFSLADFSGRQTSLGDYLGTNHVLLVFNRSFL